jgi:hypothetical protein
MIPIQKMLELVSKKELRKVLIGSIFMVGYSKGGKYMISNFQPFTAQTIYSKAEKSKIS